MTPGVQVAEGDVGEELGHLPTRAAPSLRSWLSSQPLHSFPSLGVQICAERVPRTISIAHGSSVAGRPAASSRGLAWGFRCLPVKTRFGP